MLPKRKVADFRDRAKKVREIAESIDDWDKYNFVLRFVSDCEKIADRIAAT
jgi:hypothetical protein